MLTLPGYTIFNQIYESNNSSVYRGYRDQDSQPVILKFLKQDYPTPSALVRYKQEYEITKNLDLDGVIKVYSLEKYENSLVMILEDFGGESLKSLINHQKLMLPEFLLLAIAITKALGKIHQKNIIHKDINPGNIVINSTTSQIKIIDFGISTVLTHENPTIKNPNVLEGTIAYISPEQTGRMNRAMDYRTDFYSLGVTFYELLTQQLPCNHTDAMELVHCHIAKQAVSPHEINPAIPKPISEIVMKLLAKTVEERYQTSWGIIADLEICLKQLQTQGYIADFKLAEQDISSKFQIPQKLYGREQEVATLLAAFERISTGKKEMILVSGYSGIGKSALVQEIYKPITKAKGYFISGKFDQFQRNIPYSAVVKAFQSLVRQLLTESQEKLNQWQQKLSNALGANGQLIIDVIPEVELVIGKQPPVQELGGSEAQNRFNLVFQNFIRVFCSLEHPLVIFLDDLQWADLATLKLLEVMMTDEETHYLFLIGAYRDNEVDPRHALVMTLDSLRSQAAIINDITLVPLALRHVNELITDTLHSDTLSIQPLAELVIRKTSGNPFFVNQFLKTLYQEDLLTFQPPLANTKALWEWNISNIEAIDITDNVVELMIGKLRKFPEATQQVLQLAACVGNTFDLHTLSIISEKSVSAAFQNLLPAIQEGLILPISDLEITPDEVINAHLVIFSFRFLHDRVQQAAYALILEKNKKQVHLKIGQLLFQNTTATELEEKIFDIVNHLNSGVQLIKDLSQKAELADLNLIAGKKAKDSMAYAAAREYLIAAMDCLTADTWTQNYNLTFKTYKERAEIEYLNGNFEQSEALIRLILTQAQSAIEKAEVYNILIVQYTLLTKYEEAIQAGREALGLLGINLPEKVEDLEAALPGEIAEAKAYLGEKQIASLINEEKMKSPKQKVALKVLGHMGPLTFFSYQALWKITVIKAINLSFKYGFVAGGSYCYSCYGIMLSCMLEDSQSGYEFGLLSLKLSELTNNLAQKCQDSVIFANYLNCWMNHIKTTVDINNEGYKIGLQSGNLQWSGYNRMFQTITLFFQGLNLELLLQEISNFILFCEKTQNQWAADIILANKLAVLNLIGETDELRDSQYLEMFHQHKSMAAICEYHVLKSQVLYSYEQYQEAQKWSSSAGEILDYLMGHISSSHHYFYSSLILTSLYPSQSQSEQEKSRQVLADNQTKIKKWAEQCPENFWHKYLLVEAEIARISGKILEAMELYDKAIASAREHEFIQDEALANELAAKFWLSKNKEDFAKSYIIKAHYSYRLWGAFGKVKDLETKYPKLLLKEVAKTTTKIKDIELTTASTTTSMGVTLDLATVMKAAQAISGEIVLSNLLARLMRIVIENAGAQRGCLILEKQGNWLIEAEGTVISDDVTVLQSIPVSLKTDSQEKLKLSDAIINYVIHTQENVVLNNATHEGQFISDSYIVATQPKSILCTPLVYQGKIAGILYLENNLTEGAFTTDRLEILRILSGQIAIAIENAQLYKNLQEFNQNLEELVTKRTQELSETLINLKATQSKLVEAEKMASLGGLVAGVAHEINTPVGIGVTVASALVEHTSEFCSKYQSGAMKRSDLEKFFDLTVQSGNTLLINLNRAAELIQSFKQVAVDQSSEVQRVFNFKNYLNEILIQLRPKLKTSKHKIEIYGEDNITLDSYPGALSQIVTNLLMNSLTHAYEPEDSGKLIFKFQQIDQQLHIEYADDGKGIAAENLTKIFDPFFTTKRSQGGSGLGLNLVYNLVTQKLKGEIECESELGKGSKFMIKFPMRL
ncbi:MAG: ATP-binding sensor histidine kinase [Nostoc sp. ChiSLP02]|nr:ATP-binding sensor histidine kinase [Nostoc sp. DedSLP05]MDZ8097943.1 ATP-binding sensor histidine kinase [Nostoc sp. DedSLP01]MDZ8187974.1 ATP-binding sensor histidine kinase [Nostoc sp. ChiSLP02]